jgi:predicted ribosomally synthesized peptide with nif11-like leader
MSMEAAVAFYDLLEKDTDLRERIMALGSKEKIEPFVKNELGYTFSMEEMQKVVFEKNPELTDEELEAIVGGFAITTLFWIGVGLIAAPICWIMACAA